MKLTNLRTYGILLFQLLIFRLEIAYLRFQRRKLAFMCFFETLYFRLALFLLKLKAFSHYVRRAMFNYQIAKQFHQAHKFVKAKTSRDFFQ